MERIGQNDGACASSSSPDDGTSWRSDNVVLSRSPDNGVGGEVAVSDCILRCIVFDRVHQNDDDNMTSLYQSYHLSIRLK